MANSRIITSAIWEDDWFGPLGFFEQALWIGLFSKCADDQGRLLDNAMLIRAAVFPYKDVDAQAIEDALTSFEASGRVYRYEADGKRLLQILNWWDHQQQQWAGTSRWPSPPGWHDHIRTRQNNEMHLVNWLGKAENATQHIDWTPDAEDTAPVQVNAQVNAQVDDDVKPYIPIPVPDPIPAAVAAKGAEDVATAADDDESEDEPPRDTFRARAFRAYEQNIGLISRDTQGQEMTSYLRELYDRGRLDWWDAAIKEAVDANARKWRYMRSVLDAWLQQGHSSASTRGSPSDNGDGVRRNVTIRSPLTGETWTYDANGKEHYEPGTGLGP